MSENCAIVGLDIGSSHLKFVVFDDMKLSKGRTLIYPIWAISENAGVKSKKDELIFQAIEVTLKRFQDEYGCVNVGVVTSIEAAFPFLNVSSRLRSINRHIPNINFYTIDNSISVVPLENVTRPNRMSSIRGIQYIARKLLRDGILVHMNSASMVIVPVVEGQIINQELHYSSGIGLWIGALLTPLFQVSQKGILFGEEFPTSPANVYLYDILPEILPKQKFLDIISGYNLPVQLEKADEKSSYFRLLQYFGCFPDTTYYNPILKKPYNMKNQIKIASFYTYNKLLNIILENVLKVLSRVDIPLGDLEIVISGIGKDFVLFDSLYLLKDKLVDIDQYITKPYSIFLEAFSAAISVYELINGTHLSKEDLKRRFGR